MRFVLSSCLLKLWPRKPVWLVFVGSLIFATVPLELSWATTADLVTADESAEPVSTTSFVPMEPQDRHQLLINQATDALQNNDYDVALALAQQALAIFPRDPFSLNLAGSICTKQKNYEEAQRFFLRALEEDVAYFPARFNLGELLLQQGKKEEALAYFENLNQMFPQNGIVQFKLVLLFLQTDRLEDARRLVERIPVVRDTPAWYYARAALAQASGDKAQARDYLRAAKEIFPESATSLFLESLKDAQLMP